MEQSSSGKNWRWTKILSIIVLVTFVAGTIGIALFYFSGLSGTSSAESEFKSFLKLLDDLKDQQETQKRQTAPLVQSSLGFGRRPFSGALGLQLVQFTPGNSWTDPAGNQASIPVGATLDASLANQPIAAPQVKTWNTVKDYLVSLIDWNQAATMVPSPLSELHRLYDDVIIQFFAGGGAVRPPTVGQLRVTAPLYRISMPPDTLAKQPLMPGFQKALQRLSNLPYPQWKEYYFTLFDRVGTRVVYQSVQGGMVERLTHLRNAPIKSPEIVHEALKMTWNTGATPGMWGRSDPKFDRSIDWHRQTCKGGSSHLMNCNDVKGPQQDAWKKTLWAQPTGIEETLIPISKLAKNPALAANLDTAMADYVARERKRFEADP